MTTCAVCGKEKNSGFHFCPRSRAKAWGVISKAWEVMWWVIIGAAAVLWAIGKVLNNKSAIFDYIIGSASAVIEAAFAHWIAILVIIAALILFQKLTAIEQAIKEKRNG